MDDDRDARLYVDVSPMLANEPMYIGSFTEACRIIWALVPLARAHARIETPDHCYDAAQLESMRCEDEGEI